MKLNKKTAGAIIFVFLILLLFFSKTIYSYNMPEVSGTKPARGSLSKLEISSGIAGWAETESIYAVSAGAAGRVYVREGDHVEKGQVLLDMVFDVPAAQRRYAETENYISKMEADIRGLNSRLGNIKEALGDHSLSENSALPNGSVAPEFSRVLSGQAGIISLELARVRQTYLNSLFDYELGFQSKTEFANAENNFKALLYKYEAEAEELEHSLVLKQIDLDNLRLSLETIGEILRNYQNNVVIRAPEAGTVMSLPAERGKFFPENALLVSIGVGNDFLVECNISLDNNFVNPGDTCDLSNASHSIKGTVRRVRPTANGKTVTISVVSEEVSDGETFEITFSKYSDSFFILVPNGAINQDNDGYFLYQIKRRRGIMGEEYYVDRMNIFTGDSDHQNTAIVRGITFFEPIVLVSNKVLSAGDVVSLKNPENFFEN